MRASFRDAAVATALEIGLFDPDGPGSFTHPDRAQLIYGDGKVVKPLSKYVPGETWVDRRTGGGQAPTGRSRRRLVHRGGKRGAPRDQVGARHQT
jgi:hypothetical protein